MKDSFIKSLRCPYCRKELEVKNRLLAKKNKLLNGTIACYCAQYPIISGVPFLIKDKATIRALKFISKETKLAQRKEDIPFFLLSFPVGDNLSIFMASFFTRINIFSRINFTQFIGLLIFFRVFKRQWGRYLTSRFSNKIFYPSAISAKLVRKNSNVLDAGSGAGHLLHWINKNKHRGKLVGVDNNLINLYLAKRYINPEANYIYLNLNLLLPFSSRSFDYIFANDVFHYVSNQKLLGKEFIRIANKQSLIILNHLHNSNFASYFDNPNEFSNTPDGYLKFFPGLSASLYSEEKVDKGVLDHVNSYEIKKQAKKLKTFTLIMQKQISKYKLDGDIKVNQSYLHVDQKKS